MKFIGRFLNYATVIWIIAWFVLPARISGVSGFALLFAVGLWTVLYPQGMLGVAKSGHLHLDIDDERWWPFTRFLGSCCIVLSLIAIVSMVWNAR